MLDGTKRDWATTRSNRRRRYNGDIKENRAWRKISTAGMNKGAGCPKSTTNRNNRVSQRELGDHAK